MLYGSLFICAQNNTLSFTEFLQLSKLQWQYYTINFSPTEPACGKFIQYEQIMIIMKVMQKQPPVRSSCHMGGRALADDQVISEVCCQDADSR